MSDTPHLPPNLGQLLDSLPIDQMSTMLGETPEDVSRGVSVALPALLGGLQANTADPAGSMSLMDALSQHDNDLADHPGDLGRVDVSDGQRITGHVFGAREDQVVHRLGSAGGVSDGLIRKLLPMLAPIVLSLLAKKLKASRAGSPGSPQGGDLVSSILAQVLSGAAQGSRASGGASGSSITDVLGGLLGAGRRS
ncbi:MAG: DUF937 domain-containing protein [Nocardioides sp.]